MAICASCGQENPEGARFCNACAAPLDAAPVEREHRKTVTIVFCDITGSTRLGESTDPEALRALLARYFERMKSIVETHGGSVEKFIGDAVMAVFGVPAAHEDDALRACRAAVEMRDALPGLGITGRIGVNTGRVVTGTEERLATGDAVNVAARLEQAAHPGEVLLGRETLRLVRAAVDVGDERLLELRGKSAPVAAYPLLTVSGELQRLFAAPMVGRERELLRLRAAFEQASHDHSCQLFTILGSAGVGKSRLAAEFLAGLEGRVVRGRCLSYGEGITYWPVVEILKQLDVLPKGDAARPLRSLLGETDETASAEEIAWGFRKLLEQEAQLEPLVCVLDDLHWGEETLLDLVEHVADLSRDAPILLLCIARPELLERRPSWGGGKLNATTVLLEPLDATETEQLLSELGEVPEQLHERLIQAAEGNPLFLEEMLALMRDSSEQEVEVPPTIQALLAARLDQLDPAERSVLERGSVEGRTFHRGAVVALADGDGNLDQRLVALVRKELVRPDRAILAGDDAYRFRHLLIHDAAYDALPKAERARLHERFAGWLEQHGTALVELDEILGYHLERASGYCAELGRADDATAIGVEAARYLTRAGHRADARGDAGAAANLLARAAALVPVDDPIRLELLAALGQALLDAGDLAGADSVLEEAIEAADAASEISLAARAQVSRLSLRTLTGPSLDVDQLQRGTEAAIERLENAGDELGLARAWLLMGIVHNFHCHCAKLDACAQKACRYARSCGAEREEAESLFWRAVTTHFGPLPAVEGRKLCRQVLSEARGRPLVEAAGRFGLAMADAEEGRFQEARAQIAATRSIYRDLGLRVWYGGTAMAAGEIELVAGDWKAAENLLREGYELLDTLGETGYLSSVAALLAVAICRQDRLEEAEHFARASKQAAAPGDVASQVSWRNVEATIRARRGDTASAEILAREALQLVRQTDQIPQHAETLAVLAEVLALASRPTEASSLLNEALALYQRKGYQVMAERTSARAAELTAAPN